MSKPKTMGEPESMSKPTRFFQVWGKQVPDTDLIEVFEAQSTADARQQYCAKHGIDRCSVKPVTLEDIAAWYGLNGVAQAARQLLWATHNVPLPVDISTQRQDLYTALEAVQFVGVGVQNPILHLLREHGRTQQTRVEQITALRSAQVAERHALSKRIAKMLTASTPWTWQSSGNDGVVGMHIVFPDPRTEQGIIVGLYPGATRTKLTAGCARLTVWGKQGEKRCSVTHLRVPAGDKPPRHFPTPQAAIEHVPSIVAELQERLTALLASGDKD